MEIESGDEHHKRAMTTRQAPGTGVFGQATTRNPPSETGQDDDDGDILALSEKRSGKKRGDLHSIAAATAVQGRSASRISSGPASSVPGSHAPSASVARSSVLSKTSSSDSDSDSPPRPNKRTRTKEGQYRDGDGDGDDDSDDGAKRGELRWRGTKQPVKRVARRF
jgi:hypothetical protein